MPVCSLKNIMKALPYTEWNYQRKLYMKPMLHLNVASKVVMDLKKRKKKISGLCKFN